MVEFSSDELNEGGITFAYDKARANARSRWAQEQAGIDDIGDLDPDMRRELLRVEVSQAMDDGHGDLDLRAGERVERLLKQHRESPRISDALPRVPVDDISHMWYARIHKIMTEGLRNAA
jgi:hypothetical protein